MHGPAHDQPGAIFHGILLPSAHATPRQNARRRRDASFYLSAIYLPTRSLPNRPRRAHDPAEDRFEKLLIVPFLEGARHRDTFSFYTVRDNRPLLLPPRAKQTPSRLAVERAPRGGANRRGGDTEESKIGRIGSVIELNRDGDR